MAKISFLPPKHSADILSNEGVKYFLSEHFFVSKTERVKDLGYEQALLVKGLKEKEIPSNPKLFAFVIEGAIIFALTQRRFVLPVLVSKDFFQELELILWEKLFFAYQEGKDKISSRFIEAMLRNFIPFYFISPSCGKFSNFSLRWNGGKDGIFVKDFLGRKFFTKTYLEEGEIFFNSLSLEDQNSILKVAEKIPIFLEYIRHLNI